MGDVSDTRKQILQNTLEEELKDHFKIISQERFEEVQEKVFEELEYYECTEDQCIMMIQEMLQVENVFHLVVIQEGSDTQLSLSWRNLEREKKGNDVCMECGTFALNGKVRGLVDKLVGKIVVEEDKDDQKEKELKEEELKRQKEEELKRQKEEELKRQKEEEQKKRKEEELSKIKDEERIKIENEKKIKERQTNYSYTFRSFGTINTFEYKILENLAVGILYENNSTSNETIKESSVTTAIFTLYGFNECYYCDSAAFVGVYGEGNQISTTDQGSEHKYKIQYLNLLYGYQWYWNIDISLALLGGLIYRNKSKVSETVVNNEVFSESYVQLTKEGFDFYPAILLGYSF